MTQCEMNRQHEATGYYRTANGHECYLCEVCKERLSPRPVTLYTVMTRLEADHVGDE